MATDLLHVMQNTELRRAFGLRVKQLRKQKAWTQKGLANKLDIRFSQLNKYECGLHVPPIEKLVTLAEIFDTTVDYLVTGNRSEDRPLHNRRLMDRFRALEAFEAEDQEAVIRVIDAMIVKGRIEGAVRPID